MSIKREAIEIVTSLNDSMPVQVFAEEYSKPDSMIQMEVHGSLFQREDNLVSIRFVPKMSRDEIAKRFLCMFGATRNARVRRKLMFC